MNLLSTFFISLIALSFSLNCTPEGASTPTPPTSSTSSTSEPVAQVVEPTPGDKLLVMVNHCASKLHPDSKGVGGNPLRFDALTMNPYWGHKQAYEIPKPTTNTWLVRIEEEHPHTTIPNGVEFTVNPDNGSCRHAMMD